MIAGPVGAGKVCSQYDIVECFQSCFSQTTSIVNVLLCFSSSATFVKSHLLHECISTWIVMGIITIVSITFENNQGKIYFPKLSRQAMSTEECEFHFRLYHISHISSLCEMLQ